MRARKFSEIFKFIFKGTPKNKFMETPVEPAKDIRDISVNDWDQIIIILESSFQSENSKDYEVIDEDPLSTDKYYWENEAKFFNNSLRSLIVVAKNERRKLISKRIEKVDGLIKKGAIRFPSDFP